jgi:hypothetical protein
MRLTHYDSDSLRRVFGSPVPEENGDTRVCACIMAVTPMDEDAVK